MPRTNLLVFLGTLALSTALALSCGDDSPSAPTAITAAPAIVTPAAGSLRYAQAGQSSGKPP